MMAVPQVLLAGRFPLDDRGFDTTYLGRVHAIHLHDYHARMRWNTRERILSPGDWTYSPAGAPTSYDLPVPGHHLCIHFQRSEEGSSAHPGWFGIPAHCVPGIQRAAVARRMVHIADLLKESRKQPRNRVLGAAMNMALLELLLFVSVLSQKPPLRRAPRHGPQAVQRVAAWIDARFHDNLSVTELAERAGVTQNYLACLFRKTFGMTIPHYLLTRRIEHAQTLLSVTDMPVGRIAARVGMPDAQHFNKQFRNLVGISPSAWRMATLESPVSSGGGARRI